jgi:hypothetical protein
MVESPKKNCPKNDFKYWIKSGSRTLFIFVMDHIKGRIAAFLCLVNCDRIHPHSFTSERIGEHVPAIHR